MTEEDARARIGGLVPRETFARLEQLVGLVIEENSRQNLIAPSTLATIWTRHILDSAQLITLANGRPGLWLDVGSGGGFPGLVIALMHEDPVVLAEPRAKRAAFLAEAAASLGVADRVKVIPSRVQSAPIQKPAAIISARAVAALPALFDMALPHSNRSTLWLLPKGMTAAKEVAEARQEWQGEIRLEPSVSDPDSAIVVARDVRRKKSQ